MFEADTGFQEEDEELQVQGRCLVPSTTLSPASLTTEYFTDEQQCSETATFILNKSKHRSLEPPIDQIFDINLWQV